MADHSNSVMIALLPKSSEWARVKYPHLTLVFCGKKDEMSATNFSDMVKDASALSATSSVVRLESLGTDVFGKGDAESPYVEVLKFKHTAQLWGMRRFVERWDKSEFDFNPHVTVGPPGTMFAAPHSVFFTSLCVKWGNESIDFSLR